MQETAFLPTSESLNRANSRSTASNVPFGGCSRTCARRETLGSKSLLLAVLFRAHQSGLRDPSSRALLSSFSSCVLEGFAAFLSRGALSLASCSQKMPCEGRAVHGKGAWHGRSPSRIASQALCRCIARRTAHRIASAKAGSGAHRGLLHARPLRVRHLHAMSQPGIA
eukprot:2086642-Rhodomonas_salina.1